MRPMFFSKLGFLRKQKKKTKVLASAHSSRKVPPQHLHLPQHDHGGIRTTIPRRGRRRLFSRLFRSLPESSNYPLNTAASPPNSPADRIDRKSPRLNSSPR